MNGEEKKEAKNGLTEKLRTNPWIISTFALGIFVIVLLVGSFSGFLITGNTISPIKAGEILANTYPGISVDSVKEVSGVYQVNVLYQGQILPIYVTKDGKYVGSMDLIDSSSAGSDSEDESSGSRKAASASVDDDPVLGNANAPVTIIEFSDYQCPFCRKFFTETLPQIKSKYINTGKVKLVYRDFPLNFHPMAQLSAEAADCVREKGGDSAYFKYHDKIFLEQNEIDGGTVRSTVQYSKDDLKKWAKEIGYNIDSCLDSGKYSDEVLSDLRDGQAAGVSGTPGFFINGVSVSGAQPFSVFEQIIEQEIG